MKIKAPRIAAKTRRAIQILCAAVSRIRRDIPLYDLDHFMRQHGFMLAQEDRTAWSGFLCGRDGSALIQIATTGDVSRFVEDSFLSVQWHKYDNGSVDFNCYLT